MQEHIKTRSWCALKSFVENHPYKALFFCAFVVASPSLWVGLSADDYVIRSIVLQQSSLAKEVSSALDTFAFIPSPDHARQGMETGVYPWWTDPEARLAFWRPLSAATHWLDFHLFPEKIWLMHVHSLFWYGILGVLVLKLYRKLVPGYDFAFLAAVLYVCDEAHGMSVGWLAARNAIIAPVLAVAMFIEHMRWREKGKITDLVAAVVLLALSLFSGESGVAIGGYLFAYAVFLDPKRYVRGFLSLIPYAIVVVFWRVLYVHMGYAALGTGLYIDPGKEPLQFAIAVIRRLPVLLLGQLIGPNSAIVTLLSDRSAMYFSLFAAGVLVCFLFFTADIIRQDRHARFFLLGMVLSTIPFCATLPNDRLLFFAGIGGMGFIVRIWKHYRDARLSQNQGFTSPFQTSQRILARILILVHGFLGPVLMPLSCLTPLFFGVPIARAAHTLPIEPDGTPVIIVHVPVDLMMGYVPMMLEAEGKVQPKYLRLLTAGFSPVQIRRDSETSLVADVSDGLFKAPWARSFRDVTRPFSVNERTELSNMTVEILETTNDGRPQKIRFVFPQSLEDLPVKWATWSREGFKDFRLPAIGETVQVERLPTFWWLQLLLEKWR